MAQKILNDIEKYYSGKVQAHGPVPKGVDWNSDEAQTMRFDQLLKVIDEPAKSFSILDYGCGYGGMYDYLKPRYKKFTYTGYDISGKMIEAAKENHKGKKITWIQDAKKLSDYDYIVASGLFNVKLEAGMKEWTKHILDTLDWFNKYARKGFAFNMLSSYSDYDRMKDYLYYGNPMFIFEHIKKNYSPLVSILHDYPLYDFTVIVRKTKK